MGSEHVVLRITAQVTNRGAKVAEEGSGRVILLGIFASVLVSDLQSQSGVSKGNKNLITLHSGLQ